MLQSGSGVSEGRPPDVSVSLFSFSGCIVIFYLFMMKGVSSIKIWSFNAYIQLVKEILHVFEFSWNFFY